MRWVDARVLPRVLLLPAHGAESLHSTCIECKPARLLLHGQAAEPRSSESRAMRRLPCQHTTQVNLYNRLGLNTLKKFSTAFYTSFYKDTPYYE